VGDHPPTGKAIMVSDLFERAIERGTGLPIDVLRQTPIEELRESAEHKLGRPFQIVSVFPWAGRGNVLRDRLVSREELDADLDNALRKL
jgi:hypothetical protein